MNRASVCKREQFSTLLAWFTVWFLIMGFGLEAAQPSPLLSPELLSEAGFELNWEIRLPVKTAVGEKLERLYTFDPYLVVLTNQNFLFCRDRLDGSRRFEMQIAEPRLPVAEPLSLEGRLFFLVGSHLIIVDPSVGAVIRKEDLGEAAASRGVCLARNERFVYIAGADHRLHAYQIQEDGDHVELFSATADDDSAITSILATSEQVFFATASGAVVAMKIDEPVKLWQYNCSGAITASLVLDGRVLYAAGEDFVCTVNWFICEETIRMDVKIQRALISVSDKTGVVDFARALSAMGVIIVSTGGTARTLEEAGIQAVPIDVVTGFPEMMDGRVKTLHPKIHAALLGLRDKADHAAAMKQHGIKPIDLVCVNLYPFEKTTARSDCTLEEAIENIDIGGPSMIRSAAKNYRFVTVVTSPQQYSRVLEAMRQNQGAVPLALREELARAAFSLTASYDAAIAKYLSIQAQDLFPERVSIAAARCQELRYGENPHQRGAFYRLTDSQEVGIGSAQLLEGGTPISFNNLMDANAAFELVKEFDEPAAVMVKHMNPCGCAVDENICTAYEKAYLGDVVSAFGGIAALNRPVDKELATVIMESYDRFGKARGAGGFFAEVITAPSYTPEAVEVIRTLKAWGQRVRLLQTGPIDRTRRDTRE